jgi:hypothetical protein
LEIIDDSLGIYGIFHEEHPPQRVLTISDMSDMEDASTMVGRTWEGQQVDSGPRYRGEMVAVYKVFLRLRGSVGHSPGKASGWASTPAHKVAPPPLASVSSVG